MNPRTFIVATTASDALTAQRLVAILTSAGVDAFSRAGGAASANSFGPAEMGYFDVLVATDALDRALPMVTQELEAIERDAKANAQAAEEEALSDETANPAK
jgi:hypothetical protein